MRTCGQCGHWQECAAKDGVHGECCKDVPFWALGHEDGPAVSSHVRKNARRAEDCDCFKPREEATNERAE
jgi:hypothetical protein